MKDPQHRPTPDYEKAADGAEAERQRLMAALTESQRGAFDTLREQQQQKEKAQRGAQQKAQQQQVAEKMRKHLLPGKDLRYEHEAHRHKLKSPQNLERAIDDFLSGRETPVTREYQRQLDGAKDKAKADVAREQKQEREKTAAAHKRERDEFLKACERRRGAPDIAATFRRSAADRPRAATEFSKAADQSWQRAFDKAVKLESGRGKEQERDNDRDFTPR